MANLLYLKDRILKLNPDQQVSLMELLIDQIMKIDQETLDEVYCYKNKPSKEKIINEINQLQEICFYLKHYGKQPEEKITSENQNKVVGCQENEHVFDEWIITHEIKEKNVSDNETEPASMGKFEFWVRKCTICGYEEKTFSDPKEILKFEKEKENVEK